MALDGFVSKLNPDGSALVYSTYLGGSGQDAGGSIAVDAAGDAYIAGDTSSTDFPIIKMHFSDFSGDHNSTPASPSYDVFVVKLDPAGSAFDYSTYLGGTGSDYSGGIAVDAAGNAYIGGSTGSSDFPTTPSAFQVSNLGSRAAFVTKLDASGSSLVYSTYLGGTGETDGGPIALDSAGDAYVTGVTRRRTSRRPLVRFRNSSREASARVGLRDPAQQHGIGARSSPRISAAARTPAATASRLTPRAASTWWGVPARLTSRRRQTLSSRATAISIQTQVISPPWPSSPSSHRPHPRSG